MTCSSCDYAGIGVAQENDLHMTRSSAGSDYTGMDMAQLHHRNVTRIQHSHRGVRDNYLSLHGAQRADTYRGEAACVGNA